MQKNEQEIGFKTINNKAKITTTAKKVLYTHNV